VSVAVTLLFLGTLTYVVLGGVAALVVALGFLLFIGSLIGLSYSRGRKRA
jgi:hypothetical protein